MSDEFLYLISLIQVVGGLRFSFRTTPFSKSMNTVKRKGSNADFRRWFNQRITH